MIQKNLSTIIPIIVVLIHLVVIQSTALEPTRNVSIDIEKFKLGNINLYVVCPNVRSKTDVIIYYKIINNQPVVLKKKEKAYGFIIKLNNTSDLGTYKCSVITKDKFTRNATINVMDKNTFQSPTKFVYKNEETIYIDKKSGDVELVCGTSNTEETSWYRPAQYYIQSGNKFTIKDINKYDYGTYYCVIGETSKSILQVKKVILLPKLPAQKEKPINEEPISYLETAVARHKIVRYRINNIANSNDTIAWEQPPGTILLDHGRDIYMDSSVINQSYYFYRANRNGDHAINVVGKVLISKFQSKEMYMDVEGPVAYGAQLKINCVSPDDFDSNTTIVWKKNNEIIQYENTLLIPKFQTNDFDRYSCEVRKGQSFHTRNLNLIPKKMIESKIEMTAGEGSYYLFHNRDKKELHCEILRNDSSWIIRGENIVWTYNDKIIDRKTRSILNTHSVSILLLNNMSEKDQGDYKCYQGSSVFSVKLIMDGRILFEISPPQQTVVDNVNQVAEFHCRIETTNINSSSIIWSFIPVKSSTEIDLPKEVVVDNPVLTSSTSFITIYNVLKRHEGLYVCQVLGKKSFGRLIVMAKPELTVTPKSSTIKPGGTARFLCTLKGTDGKVTWRRFDKRSLEPNKENRIGGSSHSILEIKQATKNDDGTVYECLYNQYIERVTLFVQDECALNQRKCKNSTCIDETKFCDGKNDCGDNSDEDRKKCNECSPNAIHCDFLKDAWPNKRCIIKHWKCDGIDDCGNNFDELNCPTKNQDKCIGTHFLCNDNALIPRSYWCDGEPDCRSMDDEKDCSDAQVIEPTKLMQISIFSNSTLSLTCKMSGRPIPTISWRFNWGHMQENLDYNITTNISNCSVITSTLTVNNISPDNSGIYSCEGIARKRIMAPDFNVVVAKGLVCQRPYYNNDAWYPAMCIKCYCSNLTDDCTSATGYATNPELLQSGIKPSDAAIVNYKTLEYFEPAKDITFANSTVMKYYINKTYYKSLVPNPNFYFGGAFNMGGSWLTRYGYPLTYQLVLSGESDKSILGPLVMIKGESNSIYYCGAKGRLRVFASNDEFVNNMRIVLWEQDLWYINDNCTKSVNRAEFLNILKDVRLILFKVKYFTGQTDFQMSKLTMQEAIETKDTYSWVPALEKCNCPPGYSGLSCQTKTNN